jgi:hypothetical protein
MLLFFVCPSGGGHGQHAQSERDFFCCAVPTPKSRLSLVSLASLLCNGQASRLPYPAVRSRICALALLQQRATRPLFFRMHSSWIRSKQIGLKPPSFTTPPHNIRSLTHHTNSQYTHQKPRCDSAPGAGTATPPQACTLDPPRLPNTEWRGTKPTGYQNEKLYQTLASPPPQPHAQPASANRNSHQPRSCDTQTTGHEWLRHQHKSDLVTTLNAR